MYLSLKGIMIAVLFLAVIVGVVAIVVILVSPKVKKNKNNINNPYVNPTNVPEQYIHPQLTQIQEIKLPYRKKYLLTKYEWG